MNTATFLWTGRADNVQISGSFSNWNAIDMNLVPGTESWTVTIPNLEEEREYEYKYLVDGNWTHDPRSQTKTNALGTLNNVYIIKKEKTKMKTESSIIEIERKFIVPNCYEALLERHGFKSVQGFENDEDLRDEYYDTDSYTLMEEDHWLRLRNRDWELKYPVGSHPSGSTLYHETSNPEDIFSRLKNLLLVRLDLKSTWVNTNLDDLIRNRILLKFADLKTKRSHYHKDNINIVIDVTNWGYIVGEIEVLVNSKAEIHEATIKIDSTARKLNLNDTTVGKLDVYLQRNNLVAYDILKKVKNCK